MSPEVRRCDYYDEESARWDALTLTLTPTLTLTLTLIFTLTLTLTITLTLTLPLTLPLTSAWNESALMHVRGGLVDGNRSARHHNRTARLKRAANLRGNATRGNASRNASRLVLN